MQPVWAGISSGLIIGIASVIVAIAGIAIGIFFARKQLSRRKLSRSLQITQLVSVHSEARDRIHLFFEGEEIKQVHLVKLRLKNSGNRPIDEDDFARPLTISFGAGTPLTVEVTEAHPPELRPVATLEGQDSEVAVQLAPLLLNPGDSLSLKILVRDFDGRLSYDYRIVGIAELIDADRQANRRKVLASPLVAGLTAVVASLITLGAVGSFLHRDGAEGIQGFEPEYCSRPAAECEPSSALPRGGVALTENTILGKNLWDRPDPRAVTMFLSPRHPRGFISFGLHRLYAYVYGDVLITGCHRGEPAHVELRSADEPIWSRYVDTGELMVFHVPVRQVNFLVLVASAPLEESCARRVGWSRLRFG